MRTVEQRTETRRAAPEDRAALWCDDGYGDEPANETPIELTGTYCTPVYSNGVRVSRGVRCGFRGKQGGQIDVQDRSGHTAWGDQHAVWPGRDESTTATSYLLTMGK